MQRYRILDSIIRRAYRLAAFIFIGLGLTFCKLPVSAFAGGGPENLILIVNADSASSKLLANHYIHGRGIPKSNVIYLVDVPDREIIQWSQFKTQILEPSVRGFLFILEKQFPRNDLYLFELDLIELDLLLSHILKSIP